MNHHIDHIDPKWEEGRDYQKICGFDRSPNLTERNPSLNSSKSNRFLPWRVCKDEVGVIPVEQGDWCQFLDPDTGEWVLEDFLGEWWFEKSKRTLGCMNMPREKYEERNQKIASTLKGRRQSPESNEKRSLKLKGRRESPETCAKKSSLLKGKKKPPEVHIKMWETRRFREKQRIERARLRARAMSDPQFPFFDDE